MLRIKFWLIQLLCKVGRGQQLPVSAATLMCFSSRSLGFEFECVCLGGFARQLRGWGILSDHSGPVDSLWGLEWRRTGSWKRGKKEGAASVFPSLSPPPLPPPHPRHIPLRAPLSSKQDSLGTDSHASPPSVDNQFSFLKSPPRVRELWAPALILASRGKKSRDPREYRRPPLWPRQEKLGLTSKALETYRNKATSASKVQTDALLGFWQLLILTYKIF